VVGENLESGSSEFAFDMFQHNFFTSRNNASSVLHYNEVFFLLTMNSTVFSSQVQMFVKKKVTHA